MPRKSSTARTWAASRSTLSGARSPAASTPTTAPDPPGEIVRIPSATTATRLGISRETASLSAAPDRDPEGEEMIGTEAATGGGAPDRDPGPALATAGGTVAEATAGDTLALARETDVAAAEAIPAAAAVVVTTRGEADLLRRRGAPLRMTEESTLSPQATTSESDL
jgi:hypothetical protein